MNAKNHFLGEEMDNQKGKIFEELLREQDLILVNNNEPTHYHVQTDSYTTVNLSIVYSDCYLDFNHKVLSKHKLKLFNIAKNLYQAYYIRLT